jgi:hypothetical protein
MLLLSIFLVGCSNDDGGPVLDPNVTQTIGSAGGTFNFQNNQVRLTVPAGSLSGNTNVTVRSASGFGPDARLLGGTAYTISTDNGATFSSTNKATLRIHYNSLPLGADPNSLEIFRWNGTTWEQVNSTVDTSSQTVSAQISQMGTYAIFITGGTGNPDVFRTVMGSAQEIPQVTGNAGGLGIVAVAEDQQSLTVTINGTRDVNLANVTAAHIHVGHLGENGPIAATVYMQSMGAFTDPYTKVITSADLNTSVVANMAALINLIQSNNAYLNVHTTANPNGFIRGQLGPSVTMLASLSGNNEVPNAVNTTATGDATVTFAKNMTSFTVDVNTTNLATNAVTSATIRLGAPTENGPILFTLTPTTNWDGSMTFTLDETDFTINGGINTYLEAVGAILGGRTYLQIATVANASGEIRGQILPRNSF